MPYSRTTATAALAASQLPKGNNSVVDLLTHVPVNRGSLVKSIENLLKTIESSENAVMIPTLLRDKVRVDAWELLFVAKILKASILGHGDLVEFYMNHLNCSDPQQQVAQPGGVQESAKLASPRSAANQQGTIYEQPSSASSVVSSSSTQSSSSTATNGTNQTPLHHQHQQQQARVTSTTNSSASWSTAPSVGPLQAGSSSGSSNCSAMSTCSSTSLSGAGQQESGGGSADLVGELVQQNTNGQRLAQPPSLLQLTTTNNHINSLLQYPPEQYAAAVSGVCGDQLTILAQQQQQNGAHAANQVSSTSVNNSSSSSSSNNNSNGRPHELRTSRSANCLLRTNSSGASSPRTPTAGAGLALATTAPNTPLACCPDPSQPELPGDPSALVRLLMQIEQLKSSIAHVSGQLESVVELYKKSIDNISS